MKKWGDGPGFGSNKRKAFVPCLLRGSERRAQEERKDGHKWIENKCADRFQWKACSLRKRKSGVDKLGRRCDTTPNRTLGKKLKPALGVVEGMKGVGDGFRVLCSFPGRPWEAEKYGASQVRRKGVTGGRVVPVA